MDTNSPIEKQKLILWAVDPFVDDGKYQKGSIAAINSISGPETIVQPVYVWSGGIPEGIEEEPEKIIDQLKSRADAILTRWAEPALKTRLNTIDVIERPLVSAADSAYAVAKHAREEGADLIVANHHNARGLERWLIGSFAENLALISDVSVVIAPPDWNEREVSDRILFPTDFSAPSKAAFKTVVDFARRTGRAITLFHKLQYPFYPAFDLAFVPSDVTTALDRGLIDDARVDIEVMAKYAREQGVNVKVVVDETRVPNSAEAIQKELLNGYGLVAMAAHSGALARTFLGSTSRNMLRHSTVPVWILRPGEQALSAEKPSGRSRKTEVRA